MKVWKVRFTNNTTKNSFETERPFKSEEGAKLYVQAACTLGDYTAEVFAVEEEEVCLKSTKI